MKLDRVSVCLCVLLMLTLPALPINSVSPQPFNSTAIAGHTQAGGGASEYCSPCGCGRCQCDPGEEPGPCTNSATPGPGKTAHTSPSPGGDGGALLLGGLLVMVLLRFLMR